MFMHVGNDLDCKFQGGQVSAFTGESGLSNYDCDTCSDPLTDLHSLSSFVCANTNGSIYLRSPAALRTASMYAQVPLA